MKKVLLANELLSVTFLMSRSTIKFLRTILFSFAIKFHFVLIAFSIIPSA